MAQLPKSSYLLALLLSSCSITHQLEDTYEQRFSKDVATIQELQSVESSTSVDYLDLVMDTNPDRLEAKEGHLLPVLVKAIQDLSAENTALKARLDAAGL